jgi:hypothetical protein
METGPLCFGVVQKMFEPAAYGFIIRDVVPPLTEEQKANGELPKTTIYFHYTQINLSKN